MQFLKSQRKSPIRTDCQHVAVDTELSRPAFIRILNLISINITLEVAILHSFHWFFVIRHVLQSEMSLQHEPDDMFKSL